MGREDVKQFNTIKLNWLDDAVHFQWRNNEKQLYMIIGIEAYKLSSERIRKRLSFSAKKSEVSSWHNNIISEQIIDL